AHVGHKIRDSEIRFVANAGDDRDRGMRDGASYSLFIERPKAFERATSPRENPHIDGLLPIEILHRTNDFSGRTFALDAHRIKCQVHVVKEAPQDGDDISEG